MVPVVQSVRASDCGSECRGFESHLAPQEKLQQTEIKVRRAKSAVTCLATNRSADDCTFYWLKDVAAQGTFTKAKDTSWPTGGSGIPEGWTAVETAG